MTQENKNQDEEITEEVTEDVVLETEVVEEELPDCPKCEVNLNGWKRALADYDNIKKDLLKERMNIRQSAKEGVAHELIAVLDNFDQAARFQPEGLPKEAEVWMTGLMHVRNQLESVMQGLGLETYCQPGETFDVNLHDAAAERTEEDKADQEILDVQQRGWKMGEKIVRPAKVIINNIK
jgi:molecular chaperone GrpE